MTITRWLGWMALNGLVACGCGSGGPVSLADGGGSAASRARCDGICARTTCTAPCASACDATLADEPTCGADVARWLACYEALPDADLCAAFSGGSTCSPIQQDLFQCAHCTDEGTCRADGSPIRFCCDAAGCDYYAGPQRFHCEGLSMSDCAGGRYVLMMYCG